MDALLLALLLFATNVDRQSQPPVQPPKLTHAFTPADKPNYLAVVWRYTIETDTLKRVAQADADRFVTGPRPPFLGTQDEESSGIIDVSDILGEGVVPARRPGARPAG